MIETEHSAKRRAPTDDRRDAIARAARALIVEKGVEGLRTRDIADRVGINIATLHYHVPSKEALIELIASLLTQGVSDGVYRPDIDPEAMAMVMISSFVGFCRNPDRDQSRFDRMVNELKRAIRNPALDAPGVNLSNPAPAKRLSGGPV